MTAGIRLVQSPVRLLVRVPRKLIRSPARRTLVLATAVIGSVFCAVIVHPAFLVATAFILCVALTYQGESAPKERDLGSNTDREYKDARTAMSDVGGRYEPQAIRYFFRLLSDLPNLLSAADERATVEAFGLRLETRLRFRVTDVTAPTLLVPLLQISKGSLIDELEILDRNGDMVPALSPYETRGLIGSVLDFLIRFGWNESPDRKGDTAELERHTDTLMAIVCRPHPWTDDALTSAIKPTLDRLGLSTTWYGRLHRFCEGLAQSELIVVEVDRPTVSQLDLTYRQLLAYESPLSQKTWRTRLGLTPDTVDAPPMVYAARAQSYHFQIAPIPGRYVFNHTVEIVHSSRTATVGDMEGDLGPIDLRLKEIGVRSHAHCYITLLESPANRVLSTVKDYKSVVQYRETPPGALGGTALISSATAVLTTFFAFSRGDVGNADVPALLIALPAFMAIVIGHWSDTSRIPKSSVSAYLGMLATMLISVLGALLYLLSGGPLLDGTKVELTVCCGLGTAQASWLWLTLAGLASVLALYLWLRLLQGVSYYRHQQRSGIEAERTERQAEHEQEPSSRQPADDGSTVVEDQDRVARQA